VKLLVHYETYDDVRNAIQREKNLKKWPRAWKIALIERHNPDWRDLYDDLNR
jgi:putative endonuclease